jgi:hypothetical protein
MIHLIRDHAHDAPDPADPTAGLRCPTCDRTPRLTCTPPETHPPCDAEEDAAGRWLRLFPAADAGGDVDPEPEP